MPVLFRLTWTSRCFGSAETHSRSTKSLDRIYGLMPSTKYGRIAKEDSEPLVKTDDRRERYSPLSVN